MKIRIWKWEYDVRKGDVMLLLSSLTWIGIVLFVLFLMLVLNELLS
jgi:hypothetical protein